MFWQNHKYWIKGLLVGVAIFIGINLLLEANSFIHFLNTGLCRYFLWGAHPCGLNEYVGETWDFFILRMIGLFWGWIAILVIPTLIGFFIGRRKLKK